jgi:hypothetical protein
LPLWIAWTQLHGPITPERGDMHAALVASAASWSGKSPRDLMPDWRNRPPAPDSRTESTAQGSAGVGGARAFCDWAMGLARAQNARELARRNARILAEQQQRQSRQ